MSGQKLRLIVVLIGTLGLLAGIDTAAFASVSDVSAIQSELERVTVVTDKHAYVQGDIALISGKVSSDILGSSDMILIRVYNPLGKLVRTDVSDVTSNGSFSDRVPIVEPLDLPGEYRIIAIYSGQYKGESGFDLADTSDPFCAVSLCNYDLQFDKSTFQIRYILVGEIENITVDVEGKSLNVDAQAYSNGSSLRIHLPRDLIDATESGQSGQPRSSGFTVLLNGIDAETEELKAGIGEFDPEKVRVLNISGLATGRNDVQIIGTWIAPEFGVLKIMIMSITVSCVVVWSRTHEGKS